MSSVLLVGINAKFIHTNLAIRSLRANAGIYKEQVEIAEYTINHRREEILHGIYEKRPEVIGFSCYLWNIEYVGSIACDLKKILPQVVIFLGGPEVSYRPDEILHQYEWIDFIMVGEGEGTFFHYMEYRQKQGGSTSLAEIDGLVYRDGEEIRRTAPARAMEMDELVFPYEDLEGLEHQILYYESMRGCPFSCSYCLSSIEKTVRIKSLEKTERELDFFLERQVPQVKFTDRTFNCDHKYAYQIWKYIGRHDNGVTNFHFEIAGDLLREEDFELFQTFRPGLVQFEIGVQSTNPQTLRAIRRTMDLSKLQANTEQVRKMRTIHQHLDLIAGLPYEDMESFRRSFNDVYAMKPDQLQLGFLKVLDGSHMHEVQHEYGVQFSLCPPYEVFSTKWIRFDDILRLKQVEDMVEVYYNSLQFTASMIFLERFFRSPFELYEALAEYYRIHHLSDRNHSRLGRYEILWDFGNQWISEKESELWREILTYDLFRREYVKNPPGFVLPRTDEQKAKIRSFFDRECETPHYLSGYEGFVTRQLYHMIYMGQFTVDIAHLLETGVIQRTAPYYLLFDYKKRNPLDRSAWERRIDTAFLAPSTTGSASGLPAVPE